RGEGRDQRGAPSRRLALSRGDWGPSRSSSVMNRSEFEALVEAALRKLPRPFREKLENIAVVVEDWADDQTLEDMGIEPPDTLYGLYRGVDLTRRDSFYGNVLPDTIHIYQGPIEEDCADTEEMAELIRDVVAHEVGHYFGLDDDTMEDIEHSGG